MATLSQEAIEAAARALFDLTPAENLAYATIPRWVDLHEQDRIYYRRLATAALTAAAPIIAAEALRDAADSWPDRYGFEAADEAPDWLRARANDLEAKTWV